MAGLAALLAEFVAFALRARVLVPALQRAKVSLQIVRVAARRPLSAHVARAALARNLCGRRQNVHGLAGRTDQRTSVKITFALMGQITASAGVRMIAGSCGGRCKNEIEYGAVSLGSLGLCGFASRRISLGMDGRATYLARARPFACNIKRAHIKLVRFLLLLALYKAVQTRKSL